MTVARVPISMKIFGEKMRQMRAQLKSAGERMGMAARARAHGATDFWKRARALPGEWRRGRRNGDAIAPAPPVWDGALSDSRAVVVHPDTQGGTTWQDRNPRLVKFLRIAALSLGIFVSLPYLFILLYRFVDPPFSALMLRNAVLGGSVDYRWVDFDRISPNLPTAAIIAEDSRFCSHWGVDWLAVGEAIEDLVEEGEVVRGASTIPMQTAKNLFLWPEQDFIRKALEVPLATFMTLVWPKQRVIEVYLNIAEWGPGIYGAEAAARRHFGTSAASLNRAQAALLVSALPNPRLRRAGAPGARMRRLADHVQSRVGREGGDASCIFDK